MRLQLLEDADSCSTQFRFERIEGRKRREMEKTEQYGCRSLFYAGNGDRFPENQRPSQKESGQPETCAELQTTVYYHFSRILKSATRLNIILTYELNDLILSNFFSRSLFSKFVSYKTGFRGSRFYVQLQTILS